MNQHNTVEKLRQMQLSSMATLYHQAITENLYKDMSTDEFMTLLVDNEWEERQRKKIARLIKLAGFRTDASANNIDYQSNRSLDKTFLQRLFTLNFIKNKENIIATGPTGVGKSYIAQAIGNHACQMLYKTRYYIAARFFDQAKLAKLNGTYIKLLNQLHKTPLLILDDFGLHAMDQFDRQILLDLIEERHQRASTIFCSQIPVSKWHELIGEGTIADAILDRVVYSSHRLDLQGESLRKKQNLN
ncbi:IS21-like element helper ATPase IstB [Cytophagaceae bacterium ABcell3]|nr:IS21-like element helper ATPase IstB [Cytophagaceae bacterium ABcell3]WMJ72288.1 IS21-like element helper ATPase IstB [Cytophagaceae bacterium ABcell3]WMJ74305.1 IS21-like element helper ATPase IstB [Cytophagaceae bacterium ABcell3]WMJ75135.1 IS21-like element helper ATPase IstB [Cytophagaceae bacterium ABcell3]